MEPIAVTVSVNPAYDYLCALRAVHNPGVNPVQQRRTSGLRRRLSRHTRELGELYFGGSETSLAFGLLATIPASRPWEISLAQLVSDLTPQRLLHIVANTGDSAPDIVAARRDALERNASWSVSARLYSDLSEDLVLRMEKATASPDEFHKGLVDYFAAVESQIGTPGDIIDTTRLDGAGHVAEKMLVSLSPSETVEVLTGGLALTSDLPLRELTLAPATFIYPYAVTRIDPVGGSGVIVFRVRPPEEEADANLEELVGELRALASTHRIRALTLIAAGPRTAAEVTRELGLSQATTHHHLAQLRAAGFVTQSRGSDGVLYSIHGGSLRRLSEVLAALDTRNSQG